MGVSGVGWLVGVAGFGRDALALFHFWAIFDIDVEKVQLLVALHDFSLFVDPKQRVLDFLPALAWLMHTNVDRQLGIAGFVLQAEHKFTLCYGLGQGDGLGR